MSEIRRAGEIRVHDTHIAVWEETVDEGGMYEVFLGLGAHLEGRGFMLTPNETTERILDNHGRKKAREPWEKRFSESHRYGRKGDLELTAATSGRTANVEFFQCVANIEHPNGGRYEFDKFRRMSRELRLRCVVEMINVIRFFQSLGYALEPRSGISEPLARSVVRKAEGREWDGRPLLDRYNSNTFFPRTKWPDGDEIAMCNRTDADGALLNSGDVRHFYHMYTRRLLRGTVYHHINNMWYVILADDSYLSNVASFDLFSTDRPDLLPRRKALDEMALNARLQRELAKAAEKKQWERVGAIGAVLARMNAGQRLYYILSLAHSKRSDRVLTWWQPGDAGYCFRLREAGRYTEEQIAAHRDHYDNGESTRAIPCEIVDARAEPVGGVDSPAIEHKKPEHDRVVRYRHLRALRGASKAPAGAAA
jgi:hypothetical protein